MQRVLVTAGASGIGLAIVRRFLDAGHRVHVADVDSGALAAVCGELEVTGSCVDVGSSEDVARLAEQAKAALCGIDVLVNNAGIGGANAFIEDLSDEQWDSLLRVNVTGAFYVTRAFVPLMKAQGAGVIINISTTSVATGLPRRSPYVASKAALEALTRNLARELGPFNIRCNAIRPGSIENERGRALLRARAEREGITYEEALKRRLEFISMRSRILPEEIGDMAVFLASDGARHVSGQIISVCGNVEWEG